MPISGGLGGITPVEAGAVAATMMVTVAAAPVAVVVPLVVTGEVGTVPRLQNAVLLPVPREQVPGLAVAEAIVEFAGWPMLSVNRTPGTGSPVLKIVYVKVI